MIALLKKDESLKHIPVIVLSGFVEGMPAHMQEVLSTLDVKYVFPKPFPADRMRQALVDLMGSDSA